MKKTAVLELKKVLVTYRESNSQLAFAKLCCEILYLWICFEAEGVGDNNAFATEMLARFKQGKFPFNVK